LWNQYIAEPCGIEVARYGNPLAGASSWNGNPDSPVGVDPSPEGRRGCLSLLRHWRLGSVVWIDVEREYGGVLFLEEYTNTAGVPAGRTVINELIPFIEEAIDAAR